MLIGTGSTRIPRVRVIGANLVIFFAFALVALGFLTRTVLSARQIERDVAFSVRPATHGIEQKVARLPLLDQTAAATRAIAAATGPLADDLARTTRRTDMIATGVAAIRRDIDSIHTSVSGPHGIDHDVAAIAAGNGQTARSVSDIAAAVDTTADRYAHEDSSVGHIRDGIDTIHHQVSGLIGAILDVRGQVRLTRDTVRLIEPHTRAIDQSQLLQLAKNLGPLADLLGALPVHLPDSPAFQVPPVPRVPSVPGLLDAPDQPGDPAAPAIPGPPLIPGLGGK